MSSSISRIRLNSYSSAVAMAAFHPLRTSGLLVTSANASPLALAVVVSFELLARKAAPTNCRWPPEQR